MMSARQTLVTLPGGIWRAGVRHREAELRAVIGADEMVLLDSGDALPLAGRITTLLARCTSRVGDIRDERIEDIVRSLTVGDREALLLHLRCLTFGNTLECVLSCASCAAPLESEVTVDSLLVAPYVDAREWYERELAAGGETYRVRLRLPTGADQEDVAAAAAADPRGAEAELLRRCVVEVRETATNRRIELDALPAEAADRAAELLLELDPQAEVTLDLSCAACGRAFSMLLDTGTYLLRELAARGKALYRDVHTLALHYHWSEAEIVGMTPTKRWRYLDLISQSPERTRA